MPNNTTLMSRWTGFAMAFAISVGIASIAAPAGAATLRTASAKSAPAATASGGDPGSVLYGYFDGDEPASENGTGNGGTALRLINTTAQDMCALIYIFDKDEELNACCGCPLTANQLFSFGSHTRLQPREAGSDLRSGVVAILGATALAPCTFNGSASNGSTPNFACNAGCDPTIPFAPGVLIQGTPSGQGLQGTLTKSFRIGDAASLVEVPLFDDSPGDPTNISQALQAQCKNIVQHGSGFGICQCPGELMATD